MGRKRGHAHRNDRALRRGQGTDRRQKLIRTGSIDDPQDRMAALGQPQRALAAVLGLLVALDEPSADKAIDQPARRRGRPPDRLRELADGERAPIGEDVERRQLGEPEPQLPELTGKADDQLAPERSPHRNALADLPHIRQPIAGSQDGCGQVGFELASDRSRRGGSR